MNGTRPLTPKVRPTLLAALALTPVAASGALAAGGALVAGTAGEHVGSSTAPVHASRAYKAKRPAASRPPSVPSRLRVSLARDGRPILKWTRSSGGSVPLSYLVYRDHGYLTMTSASNLVLPSLPCGVAQLLGVRAADARGRRSAEVTTVFRPPCLAASSDGGTAEQAPQPSAAAPIPTPASAPAPEAAAAPIPQPVPVAAVPQPPAATPTPPIRTSVAATPPPCGPPITIRTGGTYSGCWMSTSGLPAVRIATSEPVVITDATVRGYGGGTLIAANPGVPVDVTVRRVVGQGGAGLFFTALGFASVRIESSTVDKTGGIYLVSPRAGATVVVTRNSQRNVQKGPRGELRHFVQLHDATSLASADISWNEIVNDFGESSVEDVISIYNSARVSVHDNFVKGAYPSSSASAYSGSGIMIEAGSYSNRVYDNQILDTTNVGIGIAGGYDNLVAGNTVFSDGRLDDGTPLAAANVGIYVWNLANDPRWANNHAIGNTVGWHKADGTRNNFWFPDAPGSDYALNTGIADDRVLRTGEQTGYATWLTKLLAGGIHVGA